MKRSTLILSHLAYWTAIASVQGLTAFAFRYVPVSDMGRFSQYNLYCYPIAFYTGYLLAIPVTKSREWRYYSIGVLLSFFGISLLLLRQGNGVGLMIYTPFLNCFSGGFFRLVIDWYNKKEESSQLQKQQLKSELDLLRFQINPHFLFNTLNNIDRLIMKDQQTASKSLIMLSDIMRYMLHDSSAEKVNLKKEISYLKDYIDLEKLRLPNPDFVSFECTGNPDAFEVAPMLFIPFIENAFKHSPQLNDGQPIAIRFELEENSIRFTCTNPVDTATTEKDGSSGVGLSTVRKRLKLLYPGKHQLTDDRRGDHYHIDLLLKA